jgi:hypothetical protein
MTKLALDNITIALVREFHGLRVSTEVRTVLLEGQKPESVSGIIVSNFQTVKEFYKTRISSNSVAAVDDTDISNLSISIVLHYLHKYNLWKTMYKNFKNPGLLFLEGDFDSISTADIIYQYFKSKYPQHWEKKCSVAMGMGLEEWRHYYSARLKLT